MVEAVYQWLKVVFICLSYLGTITRTNIKWESDNNLDTYCIGLYVVWNILVWDIQVKLVTSVEGDLKAPFSIATIPRRRGGHYSIPWIAPLYHWSLSYNAECKEKRHQVPFFKSSVWLDLGLNSGLPDHGWTLHSLCQWPRIRLTVPDVPKWSSI